MTKNDDLITISVITMITLISVIYDVPVLRQVIGIVFILFCPGYTFISSLFVKRRDIDALERIALSFGLSIAIVPLIGLLLNYTPYGIRLTPILISNTSFTFLMLIVAFYRRNQVDEGERFSFSYYVPKIELGEKRLDKALSVILIISIVASLATLVYVIQAPKKGETFTEFYILGPEGMADDYPTEFALGESKEIILGIVNHEYEPKDYAVNILLNDEVLWEG
ncbi:MAG: DUF1616 domain-containing protein, partial [Candidatus Methanofastidiosa archaeon]|nr:DUF1616 domain-containing protein [Candidatus Methanofastidiosa archaeon]